MSRARHHTAKKHGGKALGKHRADGGEANPKVFDEAKGQTIGTIHGDDATKRMDRRCGGKTKRASGGKTGSDTHPYTGGKSGSAEKPYTSAHAKGGKVEAAEERRERSLEKK